MADRYIYFQFVYKINHSGLKIDKFNINDGTRYKNIQSVTKLTPPKTIGTFFVYTLHNLRVVFKSPSCTDTVMYKITSNYANRSFFSYAASVFVSLVSWIINYNFIAVGIFASIVRFTGIWVFPLSPRCIVQSRHYNISASSIACLN